jgi:hypothetical protein
LIIDVNGKTIAPVGIDEALDKLSIKVHNTIIYGMYCVTLEKVNGK